MSLRVMMMALASAMNASMTMVRLSVQMRSFLKPRLCHEFVRSTTHLAPAWSGWPLAGSSAFHCDGAVPHRCAGLVSFADAPGAHRAGMMPMIMRSPL